MRLLLTPRLWGVVLVYPHSISVSAIINYTNMAATSHATLGFLKAKVKFCWMWTFLELHQPLLRKWINLGVQLERERVGGFPCLFWKLTKKALILENIALFVYICGLNSHFKCNFKHIMEKNKKIFPCGALLLYVVHEVFIEVPLFQETCPPQKNSCLRACNFQPNFSS